MDTADLVSETAPLKRLAAILSVDAVGFSARSEHDEAAAVRAVHSLAGLVEAVAQEHGGRVFSSAGDGFMLEFATVSGALAAAQALAPCQDPPVRVGVHVDEVTVTRSGDLLGHGVNVAARLQGLARPGSALVSDAVRRAAPGASVRFHSQGRVRLDKMSHTAEVFTIDLARGRGGIRRRRPWLAPALAAIGALALAGGGVFALRTAQPKDIRVAVAPLKVEGADPAARGLADSLAGRIVASLAEHQIPVAPLDVAGSADRAGARLVVAGEARRTGDDLVVDVRLEDRRNSLVIWSSRLQRPAAAADALGEQAAASVTDVVDQAVRAMSAPNVHLDDQALSDLLKRLVLLREGGLKPDQMVEIDRQLVKLAPGYSVAHAELACDLAGTISGRPPALAEAIRAEVNREVARTIALDPTGGDSSCALLNLTPESDFAKREAIVSQWMARNPQSASANGSMAGWLVSLGRFREAEPFYRRALELDTLSPGKMLTAVFALAGAGRIEESWALAKHAMTLFPNRPSVPAGYVAIAALYEPPQIALEAIDSVARMDGVFGDGGAQAWRGYVNAAHRGRIDHALLARFKVAAMNGAVGATDAAGALAQAGDVDGAFAVFTRALDRHQRTYLSDLFMPAAAPMRSDPRFEGLLSRVGVLGYWRKTGIGADFCGEPAAPPVCRGLTTKPAT